MKCCPNDKNIKKEWANNLEGESNNISNNRVIEISNFCKVFSHPLRVKIALLFDNGTYEHAYQYPGIFKLRDGLF